MSHDLEPLLDRSGWVNRLARSLVADPHAADDLVQEAWLVVLRRGRPAGADGPEQERWLSAVVRNLARERRRGELRRRARELDAARTPEVEGDGAVLLEQLEVHRRVVEAVRGLDEPYRTAVLMRYFDGASPARIARRLEVPVRTVHSRLHRGLSKLRKRLSRDFEGGRGAWLLALLPLTERSGWTSGALAGALAMDAKLKVTLAGAVLAGAAAVATLSGPRNVPLEGPSAVPRTAEPVRLASVEAADPAVLPEAGTRERVEAPAAGMLAAEPVAADAPLGVLTGRILSVDAVPLAGVRVGVRPAGAEVVDAPGQDATTTSGADGAFTLPVLVGEDGQPRAGEAVVLDERYTPVLQPTTHFGAGTGGSDLVLVVARRRAVAGIVVDADGNRLPGAEVTVDVPPNFHARFEERLDGSRVVRWTETTDAEGRFGFPDAPALEGGLLVTVCAGFARDVRPLPTAATSTVEIVLGADTASGEPGESLVEGTVVDLDGQPVEGAHVALDFASGKSDADGRFALRVHGPGEGGILTALKRGSMPARLPRAAASNLDPEAWPDPLVLTLGGPPLSIQGRVVDADGEPVAGARVWTADLTHFGAVEAPEFGPMTTVAADVETLLRDEGGREDVLTESDGSFVLDGLIDRDYRLSVHDRETVAFLRSEPVRAGAAGLVLTLPREDRVPRVAGRVVGWDGLPVASVQVALCRIVGERNGYADDISTAAVRTDEEGRFAFTDVPRSLDHTRVFGPGIDFEDNRRPIPGGADLEELELVVTRRCGLRVELDDPAEADSFQVLDADGATSMLTFLRGNVAWTTDRGRLAAGRSESIQASERATTLVLYRGETEVRRTPLRLRHDEVNVIRP